MSAPDTPQVQDALAAPRPAAGIVSSGWLADVTTYDQPDRRKMVRAMLASIASHGALLFIVIAVMSIKPAVDLLTKTDTPKFVFLHEQGPGGGGGGSPAPAPPKKLEVPKHKAPDPVPVTPTPVPPPPLPIPTLVAPIETNASSVIQAVGTATVSLAAYGGGGKGAGIGPGNGPGVGPGTGGGFGGGAYMPGNGVSNPDVIRSVDPLYTSDAMRNKIQGEVHVEVVVLANGTVGEARIIKSLDSKNGLDQAALTAARQWLFRPGEKDGQKVPVRAILILTFRLH